MVTYPLLMSSRRGPADLDYRQRLRVRPPKAGSQGVVACGSGNSERKRVTSSPVVAAMCLTEPFMRTRLPCSHLILRCPGRVSSLRESGQSTIGEGGDQGTEWRHCGRGTWDSRTAPASVPQADSEECDNDRCQAEQEQPPRVAHGDKSRKAVPDSRLVSKTEP